MAGYNGWSMSNNAAQAYADGEKPYCKWTKDELLAAVGDKAVLCKKLTISELRSFLLRKSSWHHTSSFYNKTEFFAVSDNAVEYLDENLVANIISERPIKTKKDAEVTAPTYITALVWYNEWEGSRKHPKQVEYREVVRFMSDAKMVGTVNGNKRRTSLSIISFIEQKTKFATNERVEAHYNKQKNVKQGA